MRLMMKMGAKTVGELISLLRISEFELNRKPNMVLISEDIAYQLIGEHRLNIFKEEKDIAIKQLIDSLYMGLNVKIVKNKGNQYVEIFEVLEHED